VISVTVTPATLTFASQTVGTTSASKTITVKNNNSVAALSITGVALSGNDTGDFNPTNNCTSSLAASSSCTITVTFDPTATGSRTATLTISDINGTTDQQIVSLSGTGK
jgi:Abnormal spindle-like microcephaly-assoc'd, ASPM-SPD-2-Hydin